MTISYNWLKDYIDIQETPDELGQLLTSTGLEVEHITAFETVKGGLKGLVIGEILTCTKHPNADKLSLTTVDVGGDKPLSIVCGAANVAAGQKVVVATVGTTVHPSKGEPFLIKSAKIRGEQSEGMICAEDEIGLGESHAGIMVLNTTVKNGTPASEYFKIESDYTLEIGLTPNRVDAASHIGVARDIKASKGRALNQPSVDKFKKDDNALTINVTVENTAACPRYSGVTLTNITVAESPAWLKNRLTAIGLTPINNIVDITNYVLHETGQPLHAFDADQIAGQKVIVKTLPAGTKFTTLDNKERELTASDLMICSETDGMCIAGVFGGVRSGITEKTKNVFLESAYFSADYVRKTSMHHGLKTDASFRFERGTDPNGTIYALKRAALLMQEIAGAKISSEITDIYPEKVENKNILVRDKNINRLIGKIIPREKVFAILEALDIRVTDKKDDSYTVSVPPYRVDVIQEADISEEILRIYGLNNIELSEFAGSDFIAEFPEKDINKFKNTLSQMLVANGFYEIWTNSLTNAAYQQKHNLTFTGEAIEILNKLSEEQGILRQTMLFTGLEVCAHNINRRQKDLKLFEFGKIYFKTNGKYIEEERLAMYITGNIETENWQNKTRATTYYDLAQHVTQVIQKSGISNIKQEVVKDQLFEYALQLSAGNKIIGVVGKVKPALLKDLGIKQEIFYTELHTTLLFTSANPMLVAQEIPKFPEVRRDLSLVLDKGVSFDEIRKMVLNTEKRLIRDIIAFDVYEGDNLPAGKKAYALGFTLLDEAKTLTDEEIDKTMTRLMNAFEQTLGAVIRK
ncbi:MAG TPA: phenylalanine--tRNA ligase subunit beta [Cyclobacteriaceae bacterium]|nr:phenylalanine--tRNA ligase subunit beta [Cyclobacteriaceae bacterium]HMV10910.1 phenylalanine--tRNA ligase subunit beta [Cyclobacteriaceae bacterium]HMV89770.1 phenylalanine--tRNA ligase subunit beta [Cyclobacteriaceae bacterium]HMX02383.1 phenylalanine--tRNA ligase subunit beta [Cyclobacteriaceae bacterium]HMY94120.1 phenylalanine--tRNA ligase subunit beta [Cyclobacteriaceae bacterium]